MNKHSTTQLKHIPETMLITLWAKAIETKSDSPILQDKKAEEIFEQVDYDFSRFKKVKLSQVGCCIRAKLIDKEVKKFLKQNPDGVVIQLWAGLDARYERLGKPQLTHWYDLDLPEAIALRRQFLEETERNSFLEMSLFDDAWIDVILSHKKPILIISEGVFMYFDPQEIQALFEKLCKRFEKATVVFDMLALLAVKHGKHHDAVGKTEYKAEFKRSLSETKTMEQWNPKIHLKQELYLTDYDQKKRPKFFRILYKIPYFYKKANQRVVTLELW